MPFLLRINRISGTHEDTLFCCQDDAVAAYFAALENEGGSIDLITVWLLDSVGQPISTIRRWLAPAMKPDLARECRAAVAGTMNP